MGLYFDNNRKIGIRKYWILKRPSKDENDSNLDLKGIERMEQNMMDS